MQGDLPLHLKKILPNPLFIHRLGLEIRDDALPAAVIWVETAMRPTWIRVAEYLCFYMCKFIFPKRVQQLTVGLGQMRVELWNEFMRTYSHKTPGIIDWEDPVANFYAVKWYLARHGASTSNSLEISCIYTGQVNKYYAALLDDALMLLRTKYFPLKYTSTEEGRKCYGKSS